MKNLIFLLFSFPMISLWANTEEPPLPNFSAIASAISAGNADALAKYFDTDVEVSIFEKEDSYSRNEATAVLKDFFAKNKPKNFNAMHQGASKGKDTQYSIGEVVTATGNYRMYLYMKVVNDTYVIQEIRIGKS